MLNEVLDDDDLDQYSGDERIVKEAHKRFNAAVSYESTARANGDEDERFEAGDAYNLYQWPNRLQNNRVAVDKPMLTNNRVRQHCLQIINDGKMNKPGINIRPTGDGATYKAAQTFQSIIEYIEYKSKAEQAYDWALEKEVKRGLGYLRLKLAYAEGETFDQDIYICKVKDPRSVYLDINVKERDGSDARWGFLFEDMARDVFRETYPKFKRISGLSAPLGNVTVWGSWITPLTVRVCEYYRKLSTPDELIVLLDEDENQTIIRRSRIDKDVLRAALGDMEARGQAIRRRDIPNDKIEWFLIAGEKIIDRKDWPGMHIPIARVLAEETNIDGQWDVKGHVRAMLDPQRMYNYFSSSAVEYAALQTKTPYEAAIESISGFETFYEASNVQNIPVLPYRALAADGKTLLPRPARAQPPMQAAAYIEAMSIANQEMQVNSGQNEASFGMQGNEKSGIAIDKRKQQGDKSTYHYQDGLGVGIAYVGRMCLDLIPKVYDKKRILRIKGKDGEERNIVVDPKAKVPYEERQNDEDGSMEIVLNPKMGQYAVQAESGPGYSTLRQEAFNALLQLTQQSPELMLIFGDLMFRSADFPLADEMAERMKKKINQASPGLIDDEPTPEMQQMMQGIEQLQQYIQKMQTAAEEQGMEMKALRSDRTIEEQRLRLDKLNAVFDRLEKIDNMVSAVPTFDPQAMSVLVRESVGEALAARPAPEVPPAALGLPAGVPAPANGALAAQDPMAAAAGEANPVGGPPAAPPPGAGAPPVEGAQQAPDGNWYVPDPARPGKFMMVEPDGPAQAG